MLQPTFYDLVLFVQTRSDMLMYLYQASPIFFPAHRCYHLSLECLTADVPLKGLIVFFSQLMPSHILFRMSDTPDMQDATIINVKYPLKKETVKTMVLKYHKIYKIVNMTNLVQNHETEC